MMLFVVAAAFMLPGVLGHCCFPKKLSAITYDPYSQVQVFFQVDDAKNMSWAQPINAPNSPVTLTQIDLATSTVYNFFSDGTCKAFREKINYFGNCIPKDAKLMGSTYLGAPGDLNIDAYSFHGGLDDILMVVSKDKCMPVMTVHGKPHHKMATFFSNVSTDPADFKDLHKDTTHCVEDSIVGK